MNFNMPHIKPWRSFATGLLMAAIATSAGAECTSNRTEPGPWSPGQPTTTFKLRLPDGEDSAECRMVLSGAPDWRGLFPSLPQTGGPENENGESDGETESSTGFPEPPEPPSRWLLHGEKVILEVTASDVVEVEVKYVGSAKDHFPGVLHLSLGAGNLGAVTGSYADVTVDPNPERYEFNLTLLADRLRTLLVLRAQTEEFTEEDLDQLWDTPELVMTVRRIRQACWMAAWVTGDVLEARRFDGDVAYFRTSDERVKEGMMVGTLGDVELAETFTGEPMTSAADALALAERLGFISEEEADEVELPDEEAPAAPDPQSETFAEWMKRELRPDEGEDGDNFGLNLVAIDLDADPSTDAAAATLLGGAFTLTLSAGVTDYGPEAEGDGAKVDFRPSLVQATIGLSDKGGDRIGFHLGSLSGAFQTLGQNRDFIVGFLAGELETEGKYILEGVTSSPRILKIGVLAKFAARRGPFSCTR